LHYIVKIRKILLLCITKQTTKMTSDNTNFNFNSLANLSEICHHSPLNKNKNIRQETEYDIDNQIDYAKYMMKTDVESIDKWYNVRRNKLIRDLMKLDEDYKQTVEEHKNEWNAKIAMLQQDKIFIENSLPVNIRQCRVMRAMSDGELIPTEIGQSFKQNEKCIKSSDSDFQFWRKNDTFTPSSGFRL